MTSGHLKQAIEPEALSMLQSILRRWCLQHDVHLSCPEAQVKARQLVELLETGIQSPEEFATIMDRDIAA
jgi:hypothetical protein